MYTKIIGGLLLAMATVGCKGEPAAEKNTRAWPERAAWTQSLFTGAEQFEYLNRLREIMPTHTIETGPTSHPFPRGAAIELPESFVYEGEMLDTPEFLSLSDTAALLVIRNGEIRLEEYWLTGGPEVNWMSFSVGKSFVSTLIGIAIDEGLIGGVDDAITDYVPELLGSAYDKVRIKDVLQMSSGARWNEDYSDPESDIMRFAVAFGTGGSLDAFTASLVREREPGTFNYYNSTDTQALGMLLVRATGKSLSAYAEEKLWQPLGMEDTAYWITDDAGMEMAAGGLQVTARDYAKLGQLFLNRGEWHGARIVSEQWVHDSLTPDAPHVMPAAHPDFPVGYGYQWWVPTGDEGEFSAIGVYNQFVWVNPTTNTVIVKLSAYNDYGTSPEPASWLELQSFELFRAIDRALD